MVSERQAVRVCREFFDRVGRGDESAYDELVAEDFVNHAAAPQGRSGWRRTLQHVLHDMQPRGSEVHHFFGDDEHACFSVTMYAVHVDSTMPLLQGVPVTGKEVAWLFTHIFRVEDGRLIEHWATRDDLGLLRQLGAWPPAQQRGAEA